MSTLSAIRDYVRESTLIETDDWDSTKLNNVINEGIYEVSSRFRWPWLAETALLSVTDGTQAYSFDTITNAGVTGKYLARIEAIVDIDRKVRLEELASSEALVRWGGDFSEGANATQYFIWGNEVNLLPIPSATEADAYKIYYYRRPSLLTNDSDEPEWDPQFHLVLAKWAIARVWEREEDFEKAIAFDTEFDKVVERMASYYLNRASDVPSIVGLSRSPRRGRNRGGNTPFLG